MFAGNACVSQSVESVNEENACEAHAHTLEVLHQWQELQGAVEHVAALCADPATDTQRHAR